MVDRDRYNKFLDFGTKAMKAFNQSNNYWGNYGNSGGGLGSGSGGGTPWGAIASAAKSGYNAIANKDDKDYSDAEEAIIYPLQGAAVGSQFGPWGAAAGALYGTGYAWKDDMGLKDSNFFTQMLFPIGMGDGGGLRIGGKSIIDLK